MSQGRNVCAIESLESRRLLAVPEFAFILGNTSDERVVAVAQDQVAGNIYVAGMFRGALDVDPRPDSQRLIRSGGSKGNFRRAVYVAKYTPAGLPLWAVPITLQGVGGSDNVAVEALRVDRVGRVYVSGLFSETVDFNPRVGVTFNMDTAADVKDAFVMELDANGAFAWATTITTPSPPESHAASLELVGTDVLVGGSFPADETALSTAFLGRLDSATGTIQQLFDLFSIGVRSDAARTTDIAVVPGENNVVITGTTRTGQTFIAKVAAINFAHIWDATVGGGDLFFNGAPSILSDDRGNVYVAGAFGGTGPGTTFDFDPGPADVNLTSAGQLDTFVLRLDKNGKFVWVRRVGGEDLDVPGGLEFDSQRNLHVVGVFRDRVDFYPGPGQFIIDGGQTYDQFVLSLTRAGEFRSAFSISGNFGHADLVDRRSAISIRDDDMVLGGTMYLGLLDFDPTSADLVPFGTGIPNRTGGNRGPDGFVAKYRL